MADKNLFSCEKPSIWTVSGADTARIDLCLYNLKLSWAIFKHVREDIFEKHTLKIWLVFSKITPVLILKRDASGSCAHMVPNACNLVRSGRLRQAKRPQHQSFRLDPFPQKRKHAKACAQSPRAIARKDGCTRERECEQITQLLNSQQRCGSKRN